MLTVVSYDKSWVQDFKERAESNQHTFGGTYNVQVFVHVGTVYASSCKLVWHLWKVFKGRRLGSEEKSSFASLIEDSFKEMNFPSVYIFPFC